MFALFSRGRIYLLHGYNKEKNRSIHVYPSSRFTNIQTDSSRFRLLAELGQLAHCPCESMTCLNTFCIDSVNSMRRHCNVLASVPVNDLHTKPLHWHKRNCL